LFVTIAIVGIITANAYADGDDACSAADASTWCLKLLHMPLLTMLTPMQKCWMLLATLLVHCCVANATVAAVVRTADACDDAMLTCLQIIYVALIINNLFMKWYRNFI